MNVAICLFCLQVASAPSAKPLRQVVERASSIFAKTKRAQDLLEAGVFDGAVSESLKVGRDTGGPALDACEFECTVAVKSGLEDNAFLTTWEREELAGVRRGFAERLPKTTDHAKLEREAKLAYAKYKKVSKERRAAYETLKVTVRIPSTVFPRYKVASAKSIRVIGKVTGWAGLPEDQFVALPDRSKHWDRDKPPKVRLRDLGLPARICSVDLVAGEVMAP